LLSDPSKGAAFPPGRSLLFLPAAKARPPGGPASGTCESAAGHLAASVLCCMAGAAFFDLDRTLLAGASGPVVSAELREAGVLGGPRIPGEGLIFRVFDTIGETLPAMLLTRQMARMAKGWDRVTVQAAGRKAAEALETQVLPYARLLIAQHREEGRPVVLATTTPFDLVVSLAEKLELDDVIATRYGVADGRYDGSIDGEFVWGRGKLAAVRSWAEAHGVRLRDSHAYSDSFYDVPLLSAVGHPTAVNPDIRLAAVAAVRRWPVLHLDVPPGVPKVAGIEPQQVLQAFARPELMPFARFDIEGVEHIPATGGGLVCGNHRSYFDPAVMGMVLARAGRPVRFLGKKEVFDVPVVGQFAKALGGIRVDRGTGSDEPLEAAADAIRAGQLVALMPQGTIPRGPAFFDPELKGRWGAARLAAVTRCVVIPVGLWGTEKVWPRSARVPNVANITDPPLIRVRVGPPVELGYEDPDVDTKAILAAITDLLPPGAREPHEPTGEELARTYPPGWSGDPEAETDRRPGTD
jgi:putative phosphoserine phosphatase / 1-acylglycerol-3-phosphate O-acyltransferase